MKGIMYRYNKANLWLRTICVTVVLLGMLFFTHSQFSVAAPSAISVKISTSNALGTVNVDDKVKIEANFTLADADELDTDNDEVVVNIKVNNSDDIPVILEPDAGATAKYSGELTVKASHGDGALTFSKIAIDTDKADPGPAAVFNTTTDPKVTVTFDPTAINFDTTTNIDDPTGLDVNITAANDTAGVGDNVVFTAKITNATAGKAVKAAVNYEIKGASDTSGSIVLANQGESIWSANLTVDKDTNAGNLTFNSIQIVLNNADGSKNVTRVYDATQAKATDALVTLAVPMDNASSSSSGETTSDSPLSIVAIFILFTSVSVAIGVYTLKRKR